MRRYLLSFISSFILLSILGFSSARAQSLEELKAGVVKITATVQSESRSGTGFIISLSSRTAYIVTAAHVVEGDNAPRVEFFTKRNILVTAQVIGWEGTDERGLALLLVSGQENLPLNLVALPLSQSVQVKGGEQGISIGFPRMGGPWSVINVNLIAQSGRFLLFSGAIEEGSSGSPLIRGGKVVGLVTELGNPYGSAIPSASIRIFLDGFGVNPSSTLNEAKIAFISDRDGNREIYVMNSDGSNVTRLTNTPDEEDYPSWSPDGKKIAFQYTREGNTQVYVMDADGSKPTPLTTPSGNAYTPSWSPDGNKIIFASKQNGHYEITAIDLEGNHQSSLRKSQAGRMSSPHWSPQGTHIAYHVWSEGYAGIYVMGSDGTNDTLLTLSPTNDLRPSWFPDGEKILFESMRHVDASHNKPMEVISSDEKGNTIKEAYLPDYNIEIYVMNTNGQNEIRLTQNTARDFTPSVSPDGKKIAFATNRDWNRNGFIKEGEGKYSEIYLMNVDGTSPVRLTHTRSHNSSPSWWASP